jgi:hypothetical protein
MNMNRKVLMIAFMMIALHQGAVAGAFELGVILPEPTGLSAKLWMGSSSALDFAVSGSIGEKQGSFYVHGDYLYHVFNRLNIEGGKLPLYFGLGGICHLVDKEVGPFDFEVGARLPLGVTYIYGESLFDVFFELSPTLLVVPDPLLSIKGAMGFRFYL